MSKKFKEYTHPIPVRLNKNSYDIIKKYANISNQNISDALRLLIDQGMNVILKANIYNNFNKEINTANKKIEVIFSKELFIGEKQFQILKYRDNGCIKCHEQNDKYLSIYHIDMNPNNFIKNNIVILCNKCKTSLEKYTYNIVPTQKFLEWYYK